MKVFSFEILAKQMNPVQPSTYFIFVSANIERIIRSSITSDIGSLSHSYTQMPHNMRPHHEQPPPSSVTERDGKMEEKKEHGPFFYLPAVFNVCR